MARRKRTTTKRRSASARVASPLKRLTRDVRRAVRSVTRPLGL